MEKICLENKPVTLALVLRLADEFGNLYTQKEQQLQGLTIKPVLHTDPAVWKELRPVRFGPEGRAQFAETLTLLPGAYRLVFTCEPSPTATGAMDIEALTCSFTAVDVMRMREQNKKLLEQSAVVKSDHADLTSRLSQTAHAITQIMREKTELERSVAAKADGVRRMSQDLEAKQREATAALAVINAPPSEPRFGADARPDYRILRFKELESTLPAGQRSHIRGIVREKIKVHNVRLANMLAYHWSFDRLCQILVEGKDTLRALTDWEQRTKTYIDLLDIGDFEPKLGFVQAALTSSEDPTDDPAFVKFQYDRHRGFQPSANGQMFPMINDNSDFARQVNQCLSKASFLINCLYIPQGARRWRPLFFKILTQNMLVFHTEADLYAYIHLTKDSTSCMSLDPQRRTGGTVKTMAYRPHLFEKNQNRTPSAFLEGLDDREMQSKQFLMSLREGRELVAVKQWEKDTREATERLREEEAQLRHLAVRLQQLQQQEGELKAKLASLNQQAQRINTELRSLGEQA
jgi:predicted  nucleic acid-binding Zn-ribbon protein